MNGAQSSADLRSCAGIDLRRRLLFAFATGDGMRERLAKRALQRSQKAHADEAQRRRHPDAAPRIRATTRARSFCTSRILPQSRALRQLLDAHRHGLDQHRQLSAPSPRSSASWPSSPRCCRSVLAVFASGIGALAGWSCRDSYIYWMIKRRMKKFTRALPRGDRADGARHQVGPADHRERSSDRRPRDARSGRLRVPQSVQTRSSSASRSTRRCGTGGRTHRPARVQLPVHRALDPARDRRQSRRDAGKSRATSCAAAGRCGSRSGAIRRKRAPAR